MSEENGEFSILLLSADIDRGKAASETVWNVGMDPLLGPPLNQVAV